MPAVEVDIESIPDIIEAQLTLSYSRLSDLIKVIIEQGNGHDDEIGGMRDRMDELQRQNEELRRELDALKAKGPNEDLAAVVEQLKKDVERLSKESSDNAQQLQQEAAERLEHEQIAAEAVANTAEVVKSLEDMQDDLASRMATAEPKLALCEAFTELWGARPEQVFAMARRSEEDPRQYEHSIEERTTYLHTLPAFVRMYDELEIVRVMVQKQAADALATKTSESSRSRTSSDLHKNADQRSGSGMASQEVQDALKKCEDRLSALERSGASSHGNASKAPENTIDDSRLERELGEAQGRLSALEKRLGVLLGQIEKEAGDYTDSNPSATSALQNAGLLDLSHRVEALEEVIDGIPRGGAHGRDGVNGRDGANAVPVGKEPLHSSQTNINVIKNLAEASGNARTSSSSSHHSLPGIGVENAGGEAPERHGGSNETSGGVATPGASIRLPPLSPSTAANTQNAIPSLTAQHSPMQAASQSCSRRLSSASASHRYIEQPVVESLRKQDSQTPVSAQSQSSQQQQQQQQSPRRISLAVEQEDGLRLRVAQLEENCAILEVNKADRRELQMLETAVRNALLQQQQQNGMLGSSTLAPNLIPVRPGSNNGQRVSTSGLGFVGIMDTRNGTPDTSSRPRTASSGRPIFVGSASVNLRDGAQLTSATLTCSNQNSWS